MGVRNGVLELLVRVGAVPSEVAEWVRAPVNRQITITEARPSTAEDSPNPVSAVPNSSVESAKLPSLPGVLWA